MTQLLLWILWEWRNLKISITQLNTVNHFFQDNMKFAIMLKDLSVESKKRMLKKCFVSQFQDINKMCLQTIRRCLPQKKFNEVSQWSHPTEKNHPTHFPHLSTIFPMETANSPHFLNKTRFRLRETRLALPQKQQRLRGRSGRSCGVVDIEIHLVP